MWWWVFSPRAGLSRWHLIFLFFCYSVTDQSHGIWGEHWWYARGLLVHRNIVIESCRRPDLNSWPLSSEANALSLSHTATAVWLSDMSNVSNLIWVTGNLYTTICLSIWCVINKIIICFIVCFIVSFIVSFSPGKVSLQAVVIIIIILVLRPCYTMPALTWLT